MGRSKPPRLHLRLRAGFVHENKKREQKEKECGVIECARVCFPKGSLGGSCSGFLEQAGRERDADGASAVRLQKLIKLSHLFVHLGRRRGRCLGAASGQEGTGGLHVKGTLGPKHAVVAHGGDRVATFAQELGLEVVVMAVVRLFLLMV